MFNTNKSEKGISLLFTILITSVILTIGLGISSIIIQQIRMVGEIGHSIISFYAADSGVEQELYDLWKTQLPNLPRSTILETPCGNASFNVVVKCGASVLPEDCPTGFDIDHNCNALYFCLKSVGSYQKTKRAIEINY